MISADRLRAVVTSALSMSLSGPYSAIAKPTDLYEAALFTIMLRAAEQAGGTVLVTNDGRSPAVHARFRSAPGLLAMGDGFTYAVVTFPETPQRCAQRLEVHLGIAVAGRSGVCHECDLVILTNREADRVRRGGRQYPSARALIVGIEAKFLVRGPVLGDGRNVVGLSSELYRHPYRLVAPKNASNSLRTLLTHWSCSLSENLVPGTAEADKLEDELRETIQAWLSRRPKRRVSRQAIHSGHPA